MKKSHVTLFLAFLVLTPSCAVRGVNKGGEREPAARAREARPVVFQKIHTPTSLKERVARHRRALLDGEGPGIESGVVTLSGEGVNERVIANSRSKFRPEDMTHYNPSAPETLLIGGKEVRVLAARAEAKGSEFSHVRFFEVSKDGKELKRIVDESVPALSALHPKLKLQDPSMILVNGDLYIGGVEVTKKHESDTHLSYRHVIYRAPGRELSALSEEPVFVGAWGKKGTRFEKLPDGRYLVVSRPQEERFGGRGKIAWSVVDWAEGESFQKMMDRGISSARLMDGHVNEDEWAGPNKLYVLPDGNVMFLSHQAAYTGGAKRKGGERKRTRDYVATAFFLNPITGEHSEPQVILERKDLPGGLARGAKRKDLSNVIYPSGFETGPDGRVKINEDGTLTLWFGEGDLLLGWAKIPNFI